MFVLGTTLTSQTENELGLKHMLDNAGGVEEGMG